MPKTDRSSIMLIVFLAVLSAWVLFYQLGAPDFYDTRLESRRAEIARNMLETGAWMVPQLSGEAKLTKPPLYFWMVALCSLKTGVNEFTARLPSAAFGIATVIVTFLLGSLLFNRRAGLLSALALLVTNIFTGQSRFAEMESMLCCFIIGSIYFFCRGYYDPARGKRWFALFFAMMGLGTLTKGPFAFTFPLIPITLYLFIYKEQRLLLSRPFLSGLKYFFIILLPWLLVIAWRYPDFAFVVIGETVARFYTEGYGHIEPFYYYVLVSGPLLFPWIFFFPFSLWLAFSDRLKSRRKENMFLILWLFANVLFLSFSKAKRDFYLTPLAPAAALLIGSTWGALWIWLREKISYDKTLLTRIFFIAGALLAGLAFVAGNPFAIHLPGKRFPDAAALLFLLGLGFMLVSLISALIPRVSVAAAVFGSVVFLVLASQYLYLTCTIPIKNTVDSGKIFYEALPHLVKQENPLAFFGTYENYAISFYAHRPVIYLREQDKVLPYMAAQQKRYLVIAEKLFNKFSGIPGQVTFRSMYSEHQSWGGYLLVCNQ